MAVTRAAARSVTPVTAEEESAFQTAVGNVTDALGDKASALAGLTQGTEKYTAALKEATQEELKAQVAAAREKKQAAKTEVESAANGVISSISGLGGDTKVVIDYNADSTEVNKKADELARQVAGQYATPGSGYRFLVPEGTDAVSITNFYETILDLKSKLLEQELEESDLYQELGKAMS